MPYNETLENYFIRFKSYSELVGKFYDGPMLAQIFVLSLPEFAQREIRKLSLVEGVLVLVESVDQANRLLIIVFGEKYKTKVFSGSKSKVKSKNKATEMSSQEATKKLSTEKNHVVKKLGLNQS